MCLQGSLEAVSSGKVDVSCSGGTPQSTTLCHKCCNCTTMKQAERQQESAALLLLCSTYPNFYFIFSGFPPVFCLFVCFILSNSFPHVFCLYCQIHLRSYVRTDVTTARNQAHPSPQSTPRLEHQTNNSLQPHKTFKTAPSPARATKSLLALTSLTCILNAHPLPTSAHSLVPEGRRPSMPGDCRPGSPGGTQPMLLLSQVCHGDNEVYLIACCIALPFASSLGCRWAEREGHPMAQGKAVLQKLSFPPA